MKLILQHETTPQNQIRNTKMKWIHMSTYHAFQNESRDRKPHWRNLNTTHLKVDFIMNIMCCVAQ